jgi:protein-disulfide isomerase
MASKLEQGASWIVTAAAVVMAVAIGHREFFPNRQPRVDQSSGPIVYDTGWTKMLSTGIQVGNADAPIKVVEFVDLECPVCRAVHQTTLHEVKQKYGARVSISYVHFPLQIHRFARIAAQAAECADRQHRFADFIDVAFAKQDSLGLKTWSSYGRDAGVPDTARFTRCISEQVVAARIESGTALARREKVRGTPTILVNGWRFPLVPSSDELTTVIDDLLAGRRPVR